jgi:hypothetical protein
MGDPVILDSSERPVVPEPKHRGLFMIQRLWNWMGIPGLTLLVLGIQTVVIKRQADIMEQQTSLMSRDAEVAEVQNKLAARPNIVTSVDEKGLSGRGGDLSWKN